MKKVSTSVSCNSNLHMKKNQSDDKVPRVSKTQTTHRECEENRIITAAPHKAFFGDSTLQSIVIQPEVTEIGDYAFYGCSNLKSVKFNHCNQLFRIGSHAFSQCKSLESITLPDCVEIMQVGAFKGCKSLNAISISENSHLMEIGAFSFEDCYSLISIIIPKRVSIIHKSTFYNCASLISIIIPESVQKIERYAFFHKGSVQQLTIEGTDVDIDDMTFYDIPNSSIEYSGKKSLSYYSFVNTSAD